MANALINERELVQIQDHAAGVHEPLLARERSQRAAFLRARRAAKGESAGGGDLLLGLGGDLRHAGGECFAMAMVSALLRSARAWSALTVSLRLSTDIEGSAQSSTVRKGCGCERTSRSHSTAPSRAGAPPRR